MRRLRFKLQAQEEPPLVSRRSSRIDKDLRRVECKRLEVIYRVRGEQVVWRFRTPWWRISYYRIDGSKANLTNWFVVDLLQQEIWLPPQIASGLPTPTPAAAFIVSVVVKEDIVTYRRLGSAGKCHRQYRFLGWDQGEMMQRSVASLGCSMRACQCYHTCLRSSGQLASMLQRWYPWRKPGRRRRLRSASWLIEGVWTVEIVEKECAIARKEWM